MQAREIEVGFTQPRWLCALSLVCLDAPLVALVWQTALARAFHVAVGWPAHAALFFATWAIYLFDRLADGASVRDGMPMSLRQHVARRYAGVGVGVLVCAAIACAFCVLRLDLRVVVGGVVIGALVACYLTTNRLADRAWRLLPIKELSIGVLFACGTGAVLLPAWREPGVALSIVLFAALCATNCALVASWEGALDARQGKTSLGTRWPALSDWLPLAVVVLTLIVARFVPIAVTMPLSLSAFLLGVLHLRRDRLSPDERTALADLVLLVPLVRLLIAS